MKIGEEGELIIRGPGVMKGYWNMPEETSRTIRTFKNEQWLFTGDIVRMDRDGYLYVVDRVKDMIDVRGFNVFSRELEELLYLHPIVDLCAVVGVPDPKRAGTSMVKAIIQPRFEHLDRDSREVINEIEDYCKKNLAHYKVPRVFEIVRQIPLTSLGKVDKKVLRPGR